MSARETRARRGRRQEELGAAAGLHRNSIGAIERGEGKRKRHEAEFAALAHAYHINSHYGR